MKKKIGALLVGALGSISTTVITGVFAKKMGIIDENYLTTECDPLYKDLDFVNIQDITFGGWDIVKKDMYSATKEHKVVNEKLLDAVKDKLESVVVLPGAATVTGNIIDKFIENSVKTSGHRDAVTAIINDIKRFKERHKLDSIIVVNLASTEVHISTDKPEYQTLAAFEKALDENSPAITFGMLYAYAALKSGSAYINFTPSVTVDIPALMDLAVSLNLPIAGKDGKTGQTLYKTVIAPMLKERSLKLKGWYSVNILGNRDGEVLSCAENLATKIESKKNVLPDIMGYSDFDHQVNINYYKPRGDAKEAWDNIDFTGWLNEEMSMKINWLGKDSILAAPLVLDLIRWVDFFQQQGEGGILTQLSSYFKSPYNTNIHNFFEQVQELRNHVSRKYALGGVNA
ncbi:MAG: inositol-3-phosphate synthase [Nitrospirota bacterium]|nr:inositol-3-phosphate synthase [Nitrospirota bacterium]